MPELPEVESIRRALAPVLCGARFERVDLHRPDLRMPFPRRFRGRLLGQVVRALTRRAKYLLADLSSGDTLVMHLGMSGAFRTIRAGAPPGGRADAVTAAVERHDHVVFHMSSGAVVAFNDPRRFGFMDLVGPGELADHPALGRLGPEPLSDAFNAVALARACRGKKTSLKAALLDQRVVAGLGNIYASEALHLARLSPARRASTISTTTGRPRQAAYRLTAAIKEVLTSAIARRERASHPSSRFRVYDRDGTPCRSARCAGTIRRQVQAGRSTFFCPRCQR